MSSRVCTSIGEIASVFDGPHATPKKIESGPIFLSISSLDNGSLDLSKSAHISESDFQKWTKRVTPEEGDILFSYETRLGEAALMPPNIRACLGRRMGLLRPNREKVLPEYLLYAYLSPGFQEVIRSKTIHGATVDRIALKELPSFPITIPSLEQQKKIVQQLKTLDKKINSDKIISSLLEQIAHTIFKSWFVNFEPTKAKIAAREALLAENPAATPEQIATAERQAAIQAIAGAGDIIPTEQLQTIADLFPNRMVDSELGDIPEKWKISDIGTLSAQIIDHRGKTPKKLGGVWVDDGIPAISAKNIKSGRIVRKDTIKFVDEFLYKKWMKLPLEKGDILMTSEGPMGELFYLAVEKKLCLSQRLYGIRANLEMVSSSYLYFWLSSEKAKSDMEGRATGTTVIGIRQSELRKVTVLLPPNILSKLYHGLISSFMTLISINDEQNESLEEIRDEVLPKLLSGEII